MMNKCCFCISLRTATLFLAALGAITHFNGALLLTAHAEEFDDSDSGTVFGLTLYSYLSALACVAGAIGVLKHNVKYLSLFSSYYFIDLALHTVFAIASAVMFFGLNTEVCKEIVSESTPEEPIDMETCETAYIASAWIVTVAMAFNMLLKLHFAFAIRSYLLRVKQEEEQQAPPAYEQVSTDEIIYVAGQEYIPDEKKQQPQQQ